MRYMRFAFLLCLLIFAGSSILLADSCASTTTCTLTFTDANGGSGFGTGNFGTLSLTLVGGNIAVVIDLADGFYAINTGFPGVVGFVSGQAITDVTGLPTGYSGWIQHGTNDLHWDGFGFSNTAVATTGPKAGSSDKVNILSFTVENSFTDVEQILNLFNPAGGDGPAIFVVDVINTNTSGPGAGNTGLIAVTPGGIPIPEPSGLMLLGSGLFGLAAVARRKLQQR